jgi:hypothetical protein
MKSPGADAAAPTATITAASASQPPIGLSVA